MRFKKHMFALGQAYDLGYEQCRLDTNRPDVQQKPLNEALDPLAASKSTWPVREFNHKGVKTRIYGPESRK